MDVLVVDDSRVMRQLVRRTIRQAGYQVDRVEEAEDGEDALKKLQSFRPSLILSDWNMPKMGGLTMLQEMRSRRDNTPLAFVTSESTADMRQQAISSGALFLLAKPFTAEILRHYLIEFGFAPTATLIKGDEVHEAMTEFNERSLASVISKLVGTRIEMKPGPKFVRAGKPAVCARWVDDDDRLVYAGFCELALAASFGGSLGLRPAPAVARMVATKTIEESLRADIREVFNVISRVFNDSGSRHVRLEEIYLPSQAVPGDTEALEATAKERRDYLVAVPKYGNGRLAIVSSSPEFIAYPG